MTTDINYTHGDIHVAELTITDEITGEPIDLEDGNLVVTVVREGTHAEVMRKENGDGVQYQEEVGVALMTIFPEDVVDQENAYQRWPYQARFYENDLPKTAIKGVVRVSPGFGEGGS